MEEWTCSRCGRPIRGVAYVSDSPWGRGYLCAGCRSKQRDRLTHLLTLASVKTQDKRRLLDDLEEMETIRPRPCEVCGRRFAWVGRVGPRLQRLPRPRLHVCSDICRREQRNRARRVRREERVCEECGEAFVPRRADQRYHSAACRQRAYRRRSAERDAAS